VKVVRGSEIPDLDAVKELPYASLTTGGEGPATIKSLLSKQNSDSKISLFKAHWFNGTRNKLHTHTEDQVLIVTGGKGLITAGKEEIVLYEGDVVFIPAGEKHSHGAAEGCEFHNYSIVMVGSKTEACE